MRLNYWVVFCGGEILTLAFIPSVITNLKLIICASEPQCNGISKAYTKAAEGYSYRGFSTI